MVGITEFVIAMILVVWAIYIGYRKLRSVAGPDAGIKEAEALLARGDPSGALKIFESLLEEIPEKDSRKYAYIKHKVGLCHIKISDSQHDKERDLIKAVRAFKDALKVYRPADNPIKYSKMQMDLGLAYQGLAEIRDKETNLQEATKAFEKSLAVIGSQGFPVYEKKMKDVLEGIGQSD
jgi:tetratricopeptide (TPR) repeat protein